MSTHSIPSPEDFRRVLSHYPTGVAVVTAIGPDGDPAGMAVNSFVSASLEPPLVTFLSDLKSTSFPKIRAARTFCVNVLNADQQDVCQAFARSGGDKFTGLDWSPGPSGAPLLEGAAAWIDCALVNVTVVGDHYLVVARARQLETGVLDTPLVFCRGAFGRYAPSAAPGVNEPGLVEPLRHADLARDEMQRVALETGAECVAVAANHEQLTMVASAGLPDIGTPRSRAGQCAPYVPPMGALFLRDAPEAARLDWLDRGSVPRVARERAKYLEMIQRTHTRGWSIGLASRATDELELACQRYASGDRSPEHHERFRRLSASAVDYFEPEMLDSSSTYRVRYLAAPVYDPDGNIVLLLALWGHPRLLTVREIEADVTQLQAAAARVGAALAVQPPADSGTPPQEKLNSRPDLPSRN